ncbi:LysR family transcriptional regulator [Hydrogenophaga sp.]|uniref:LysR family transcriptional regulator n=1 Tax=Hydrogenophaga sp. TaxID=1904254 RepID=UPI00271F51F6|nr:LysR family transcriptional regulator [Hydrogenophaga sp.]MDO9434466.1 LysR family transcriptional regulator [Hydrogenophaga sp.]
MNASSPPLPAHTPSRLMRRAHLLGDFLVVADTGGIRQAADKLHLSQSALTRRIQDLEATLGASLFERTARGMSLTPFGQALLHHASIVALSCQYALSELGDLRDGEAGTLRIAAGPAWAYATVPDAVAHMQSLHPKVHVTLINQLNESTLPMLSSGKLDVVLGGLPPTKQRDPQITYEPLLHIEHLVYAHESHPLHQRAAVRAADLAQVPWVWFIEAVAARESVEKYFQRARLPAPVSAVETSGVQLGLRVLRHARHVMVLPSTLREIGAGHGVHPLPLDRSLGRFSAGMMYRPSVRRLKAFEVFRAAVMAELAALKP